MKKLIAILLAVAMLASMATVVSANEYEMGLKTTVPAATYTLYIPTVVDVPYGAESIIVPLPEVVTSSGFQCKNLEIEVWDGVYFGEGNGDGRYVDMEVWGKLYSAMYGENSYSFLDLKGLHYEEKLNRMFYGLANENGELAPECYIIRNGGKLRLESLMVEFNKADWGKLDPGEYTGHIGFRVAVREDVLSELDDVLPGG